CLDLAPILQGCRQIHVAQALWWRRAQRGTIEIIAIDAAAPAVEVVESGARLADIARGGRQQGAGAKDIAAHGLTLEALTQPEQRGTAAIDARGFLDQAGRNAGDVLAPCRRAVIEPALDLLPAECMAGEVGAIDQV